jgi:hypothetical protein
VERLKDCLSEVRAFGAVKEAGQGRLGAQGVEVSGGLFAALGDPLGGAAGGSEMAAIEVTNLCTVGEQHSVALPVETVGEQNATLATDRHAFDLGRRDHPVTAAQFELIGVRFGQSVRLPERHDPNDA